MKNLILSFGILVLLGLSGCLNRKDLECTTPYYVKRIEVQVSPAKQVYNLNDTIWFEGEFNTLSKPDQPGIPGFDFVDQVLDFRRTFNGIDIAPLELREVEGPGDLNFNAYFAGTSFTFISGNGMQNAQLLNQNVDILGKFLFMEPTAEVIKFRFGLIARARGDFAIYLNNTNVNRCDAPSNIPHLLQLLPEMPLAGANNQLFRTLKLDQTGLRVEPAGGVPPFGIEKPQDEFTIIAIKVQ